VPGVDQVSDAQHRGIANGDDEGAGRETRGMPEAGDSAGREFGRMADASPSAAPGFRSGPAPAPQPPTTTRTILRRLYAALRTLRDDLWTFAPHPLPPLVRVRVLRWLAGAAHRLLRPGPLHEAGTSPVEPASRVITEGYP